MNLQIAALLACVALSAVHQPLYGGSRSALRLRGGAAPAPPSAGVAPAPPSALALHELQQEAQEERLGLELSQHPIALDFARAQVAACARYLDARVSLLPDTTLDELIARLATYPVEGLMALHDQYAGRPPSTEFVARVHRGEVGNLREMMSHIFRFFSRIVEPDVVGADALPVQTRDELLRRAGFNRTLLHETLQLHAVSGGMWHSAWWLPERRIKGRGRILRPAHGLGSAVQHARLNAKGRLVDARGEDPLFAQRNHAWSWQTRAEFVAKGGVLSPVEEHDLRSERGARYVPWAEGGRVYTVNESDAWVEGARAKGWPLVTGLSSVAAQYQLYSRLCGAEDVVGCRAACLGYLLPIRAHSCFEVLEALAMDGGGERLAGRVEPPLQLTTFGAVMRPASAAVLDGMASPRGVGVADLERLRDDPRVGRPLCELALPHVDVDGLDDAQLRGVAAHLWVDPATAPQLWHGADTADRAAWLSAVRQPCTSLQKISFLIVRPDLERANATIHVEAPGARTTARAAGAMVSYHWRTTSIGGLIEALRPFSGGGTGTGGGGIESFWLDVFSYNVRVHDPWLWLEQTRRVLRSSPHMPLIVVVDRWDAPAALTRSWVLWEIYCAAQLGRDIHLAMIGHQRAAAARAVRESRAAFDAAAAAAAASCDIDASAATEGSQRSELLAAVRVDAGGVGAFNAVVREAVARSYAALAAQLETDDAASLEASCAATDEPPPDGSVVLDLFGRQLAWPEARTTRQRCSLD